MTIDDLTQAMRNECPEPACTGTATPHGNPPFSAHIDCHHPTCPRTHDRTWTATL